MLSGEGTLTVGKASQNKPIAVSGRRAQTRTRTLPREARRQAIFWLADEGDEESVAKLTWLLLH
jgi:hypothetical protein